MAEGSTLWKVSAWNAPPELGGQEELIGKNTRRVYDYPFLTNYHYAGDIILKSPLVTSLWGDAHLFFRHQDMRDDFILHPEWDQYTDKFGDGLIPTEC